MRGGLLRLRRRLHLSHNLRLDARHGSRLKASRSRSLVGSCKLAAHVRQARGTGRKLLLHALSWAARTALIILSKDGWSLLGES